MEDHSTFEIPFDEYGLILINKYVDCEKSGAKFTFMFEKKGNDTFACLKKQSFGFTKKTKFEYLLARYLMDQLNKSEIQTGNSSFSITARILKRNSKRLLVPILEGSYY